VKTARYKNSENGKVGETELEAITIDYFI